MTTRTPTSATRRRRRTVAVVPRRRRRSRCRERSRSTTGVGTVAASASRRPSRADTSTARSCVGSSRGVRPRTVAVREEPRTGVARRDGRADVATVCRCAPVLPGRGTPQRSFPAGIAGGRSGRSARRDRLGTRAPGFGPPRRGGVYRSRRPGRTRGPAQPRVACLVAGARTSVRSRVVVGVRRDAKAFARCPVVGPAPVPVLVAHSSDTPRSSGTGRRRWRSSHDCRISTAAA